jgi:hypothetical protein
MFQQICRNLTSQSFINFTNTVIVYEGLQDDFSAYSVLDRPLS